MEGKVHITFEQWAEVAALCLDSSSRERLKILERFSLDPEAWIEADTHFSSLLCEEIGRGIFERADIYAGHCARAKKAREAESGKAADISPKKGALGSTAMAFDISKLGPALPFGPQKPAEIALAHAAWHDAHKKQKTPLIPSKPQAPELAFTEEVRAISEPVLPFGAEKEALDIVIPTPQEFPLERYASLCVELDLEPEQALSVLQRYGLKPEQKAPLDRLWEARLSGDSEQRNAFQHAKTVYVQWLLRMRRESST